MAMVTDYSHPNGLYIMSLRFSSKSMVSLLNENLKVGKDSTIKLDV